MILSDQAIRKIADIIPYEYKPQRLSRYMRKDSVNFSAAGRNTLTTRELQKTAIMLAASSRNMSMANVKKMELIERSEKKDKNIRMIGRSLFLFSNQNCIRRLFHRIVSNSWYDTVVLILIAISTILLVLDNPNSDPTGELNEILIICDYVLTTLFTLECLINIILFGLICNG